MVDAIGPMVRGDRSKAAGIRLAHVAGGARGGGGTGVLLGAGGAFARNGYLLWIAVAVAGGALVGGLARDGKTLGTARQAPGSWRSLLPPGVVSFLNGFDLGLGWSTRIYFVSYLAAMTAAFVSGHALWGALIGASFGGSRAATVVLVEAKRRAGSELVPGRGKAVAINAVAVGQFLALTLAAVFMG